MSGSLAQVRVNVRGGRWLLPWIISLLVAAALAAVVNSSLSGAHAIGDAERQQIVLTQAVIGLPPASVDAEGDAGQLQGRSCTELFGSYNWWLFSSGRHGPCGLDPDAWPGSPQGE